MREEQEARCLVSVIVPVYNAEKTLESCIGSILNQTHRALEVLAVDDGSTDQSLALLRRTDGYACLRRPTAAWRPRATWRLIRPGAFTCNLWTATTLYPRRPRSAW